MDIMTWKVRTSKTLFIDTIGIPRKVINIFFGKPGHRSWIIKVKLIDLRLRYLWETHLTCKRLTSAIRLDFTTNSIILNKRLNIPHNQSLIRFTNHTYQTSQFRRDLQQFERFSKSPTQATTTEAKSLQLNKTPGFKPTMHNVLPHPPPRSYPNLHQRLRSLRPLHNHIPGLLRHVYLPHRNSWTHGKFPRHQVCAAVWASDSKRVQLYDSEFGMLGYVYGCDLSDV